MVSAIKHPISNISIKAMPNKWQLKNKKDQAKLKTNWMAKRSIALFFWGCLECQIIAKAMPIIKYKIVQTGPKIKLGGLKLGLFKYWYQSVIDWIVLKPLAIPKVSVVMVEINILKGNDIIV